jgi:hypothetical protein
MLAGDQSTSTGGAAAGSNGTLAYVGTFSGEIELANGPLMNPWPKRRRCLHRAARYAP